MENKRALLNMKRTALNMKLNDYQVMTLFKVFDKLMKDWEPEDKNGVPNNFHKWSDEEFNEKAYNAFQNVLRFYFKICHLENERKSNYRCRLADDTVENNILFSISSSIDDLDKIYYLYRGLKNFLELRFYNKHEFKKV